MFSEETVITFVCLQFSDNIQKEIIRFLTGNRIKKATEKIE